MPQKPMKFAVIGAAGYLGLNVVHDLLKHEHEVIGIDRVSRPEHFPEEREGKFGWALANLFDHDALTTALSRADVAIHLAAFITMRQDHPTAERVNSEGVARAAWACRNAGVGRMVLCSSLATYVYGASRVVNEESPRSSDPGLPVYHRSKYAGEQALLRTVDDGLDAVICNPTGIVGPRDSPTKPSRLNGVILSAARGKALAGLSSTFDMVDVRDVARGLVLAAQTGRTGENYILSGQSANLVELQRQAASRHGHREPMLTVPARLLAALAPVANRAALRFGSEAFAPASVANLVNGPRVDSSKARTELNYAPRPIEQSVAELLDWFTAGNEA